MHNSGCGKKEAHVIWSMVIPEKTAPVIGITSRTIGPVPADSRQSTPSVRNCASRITKWTPPRKSGGIPRVSTRFSLSVKNEKANAGRDGRTCLARPNSQARTGQDNILFPVQLTTSSRIGNLTRLVDTLLLLFVMMSIHNT